MSEARGRVSAAATFLSEQIITPLIRKAFTRLEEGLDATTVKQFQYEGAVVEAAAQVDFTERREAAKEVLKLGDYYPDRLDVNIGGDGLTVVLKGLDEARV